MDDSKLDCILTKIIMVGSYECRLDAMFKSANIFLVNTLDTFDTFLLAEAIFLTKPYRYKETRRNEIVCPYIIFLLIVLFILLLQPTGSQPTWILHRPVLLANDGPSVVTDLLMSGRGR